MYIYNNDNQLKEYRFLKSIDQSYDTLHKQITVKRAVLHMVLSWQQMYKSSLLNMKEINKEYLFTEEELSRIFNLAPGNTERLSSVLNKFASNSIIYIHRNHYYSLPKIIESYWVLERIVPLTFFWQDGEFDKEGLLAHA